MTKKQKIAAKSLIFTIGTFLILFGLILLIASSMQINNTAKEFPQFNVSVASSATLTIFSWLLFLLAGAIAVTLFVLVLRNTEKCLNLANNFIILSFSLMLVLIIFTFVLYCVYASKYEVVSSLNNAESVQKYLDLNVMGFTIIMNILTMFVYVVAIIYSCCFKLYNENKSDSNLEAKTESVDTFEQQILINKISDLEEKIKTLELENKYFELSSKYEKLNKSKKDEKKSN